MLILGMGIKFICIKIISPSLHPSFPPSFPSPLSVACEKACIPKTPEMKRGAKELEPEEKRCFLVSKTASGNACLDQKLRQEWTKSSQERAALRLLKIVYMFIQFLYKKSHYCTSCCRSCTRCRRSNVYDYTYCSITSCPTVLWSPPDVYTFS